MMQFAYCYRSGKCYELYISCWSVSATATSRVSPPRSTTVKPSLSSPSTMSPCHPTDVHEESRNKSDVMNDDYNNLIQDYYAVLQNDGDVSERDGTTHISWWSWNTPTDVQAAEKEKGQRVKRRKQKRR
ncbi:hypothetical protein ACFX14_011948 [Malus domestica]